MSWKPSRIKNKLREMNVSYEGVLEKADLASLYARHKVGTPNVEPAPIDPWADMPESIPIQLVPSNGCWALTPSDENPRLMSLLYVYFEDSAIHSREYAQVSEGSKLIGCQNNMVLVKVKTGSSWSYRIFNQAGFNVNLYSIDETKYSSLGLKHEVADCCNGIWGIGEKAGELGLVCINYHYTSGMFIEEGIDPNSKICGSSTGGAWLLTDTASSDDLAPGLWFITILESICALPDLKYDAQRPPLLAEDDTGKGVWYLDDVVSKKLIHVGFDKDDNVVLKEQVIEIGQSNRVYAMCDAGDRKGVYILQSGSRWLFYRGLGSRTPERICKLPHEFRHMIDCGKGGVWLQKRVQGSQLLLAYVDRDGGYYECSMAFPGTTLMASV
ncbi:MAG: hypothetical protein ACO363_08800, partial [Balneolaceae bacterium]